MQDDGLTVWRKPPILTLMKNSSIVVFALRVREILDAQKMGIGDLAEKAGLNDSLVSKLLTETDDARREPKIEHVLAIARALEISAAKLCENTTAMPTLLEWVPIAELNLEVNARTAAQLEASKLRTQLAGAQAEKVALATLAQSNQRHVADLERDLIMCKRAMREAADKHSHEHASLTARLDSASNELNAAFQTISTHEQSLANWASAYARLHGQCENEKDKGWAKGLFGVVAGAAIAIAGSNNEARPHRRK